MKKNLDRVFRLLQQFVCELYGESGDDVNACRLVMVINKGKDFENMSPSRDALYQHTLRSAQQGGNIWSYIYQAVFTEENVELWGYISKSGIRGHHRATLHYKATRVGLKVVFLI